MTDIFIRHKIDSENFLRCGCCEHCGVKEAGGNGSDYWCDLFEKWLKSKQIGSHFSVEDSYAIVNIFRCKECKRAEKLGRS